MQTISSELQSLADAGRTTIPATSAYHIHRHQPASRPHQLHNNGPTKNIEISRISRLYYLLYTHTRARARRRECDRRFGCTTLRCTTFKCHRPRDVIDSPQSGPVYNAHVLHVRACVPSSRCRCRCSAGETQKYHCLQCGRGHGRDRCWPQLVTVRDVRMRNIIHIRFAFYRTAYECTQTHTLASIHPHTH